MQPLADQILAFLLVTLLGMLLGFFYDFYRVIRQIWRPKAWGTILGDAAFWIFTTILAYWFLLYFIWGEVRFYVFLAMASGLAIYLKLGSRYIRYFLLHLYLLCAQVFPRLIKLLLFPFWLIWRILLLPCRFLAFFILLAIKGLRRLKGMLRLVLKYLRDKNTPPPPDEGC